MKNEKCRLYCVDQFGNLFSIPKGFPICTASFQRGNTQDIFDGWLAIQTNGMELRIATTGFRDGYPTSRHPGEIALNGVTYGRLYADKAKGASELYLELAECAVTGGGIGIPVPGRFFAVRCPGEQQSYFAPSMPQDLRASEFRSLEYDIESYESQRLVDRFRAEQTLFMGDMHRTIAVYGVENIELFTPFLILLRFITLTGFPSDAMPLNVVERPIIKREETRCVWG